jgi:hypothetical protein
VPVWIRAGDRERPFPPRVRAGTAPSLWLRRSAAESAHALPGQPLPRDLPSPGPAALGTSRGGRLHAHPRRRPFDQKCGHIVRTRVEHA